MSSKEVIKKEIDDVPEERLDELHRLIREFAESKDIRRKGKLMERLRQITIHGPKDFSQNIDAYLNEEISRG